MMWDTVMGWVIGIIRSDLVFQEIYSGAIRMAGTGKQQVPGLEWHLIGDTEGELWAPVIVQFDQWATDMAVIRRSEARLRSFFHRDLPMDIGGTRMWTQYEDGAMLATPDRSGFMGRALRFRFTPLRQQYALPVHDAIPLLPDRSIRSFTTGTLADGATELGAAVLADGLVLYEISVDQPCRVIFYSSAGARDADVGRPSGTLPTDGMGVLAEFEFLAPSTVECGPLIEMGNAEDPESANIYYAVTNNSGASAAVTITVTYVAIERR